MITLKINPETGRIKIDDDCVSPYMKHPKFIPNLGLYTFLVK